MKKPISCGEAKIRKKTYQGKSKSNITPKMEKLQLWLAPAFLVKIVCRCGNV